MSGNEDSQKVLMSQIYNLELTLSKRTATYEFHKGLCDHLKKEISGIEFKIKVLREQYNEK